MLKPLTPADRQRLSDLCMKIACGGKVETPEEQEMLWRVAEIFNKPIKKYDCPRCFLIRLLRELKLLK